MPLPVPFIDRVERLAPKLTPRHVSTWLGLRGRRLVRDFRNRWLLPDTDLGREFDEAGTDFDAWLGRRRSAPRQYVEAAVPHLAALRRIEPDAASATVAAAAAFCEHRFALLGSPPFTPVDPDRPARPDYRPIDWYLDPVRELRFPRGVPYKDWKLFEMRPGNADIKYPWELARCQHWVTLAQAWRLGRESRFAIEIARELDDFLEANPVGIGIHWTCTMDVALRAANWCLALSLLLDCGHLDDRFWRRAYGALFEHGRFIHENLENIYEVTSNHYLSNVVGLHFIAAEFIGLPQGARWNAWCRKALETEIGVQVHDEGADFESSVPYHRLVTELFLGSARLARLQGQPLSAAYEDKLARMAEYQIAVTRPDGLMPVIGDADDGRLHIFSHFGGWNPQDGRHLVAPAAALLERPEWLASAGPHARWEAAWWGYPPEDASPTGTAVEMPAPVGRLFPESGVAVARRGGHYLIVTNGAVGTKGYGNHKHNELLSFEYHCGGVPLVVDPGSYVYTADFDARNLFRGTGYHNTLMVDGLEQNEVNPEWLFRMFERAHPEHLGFAADDRGMEYRGRHRGFAGGEEAVVHERRLRLDLESGLLLLDDRLDGNGTHDLRWHFHLAPGVTAAREAAGRIALSAAGKAFRLVFDPSLAFEIGEGWYSPSYGVQHPVATIKLSVQASLAERRTWGFALGPADVLTDDRVAAHVAGSLQPAGPA